MKISKAKATADYYLLHIEGDPEEVFNKYLQFFNWGMFDSFEETNQGERFLPIYATESKILSTLAHIHWGRLMDERDKLCPDPDTNDYDLFSDSILEEARERARIEFASWPEISSREIDNIRKRSYTDLVFMTSLPLAP